MIELLLYGLVAGFLSLLGGFVVVWRSKTIMKVITPLVAFAAGAFLGVSFLDLLPEAVEMVEEPHNVFAFTLLGFFIFFALERALMKYFRRHDDQAGHADHTESISLLVIIGDTLHNFLDGIVIALAYLANPALGLTTAVAVAAHELPQEIGDFTILLDRGWPKAKIILVNVLSASFIFIGIALGYYAGARLETSLPYLLATVAGIFIYIAASDLIPEIHHRAGHKYLYRVLFAFLLGLVLVGYLVMLTHGQ